MLVVENKISSGIGYAAFFQPNTDLGGDDPEKTTGDGTAVTPDAVSADQLARYGIWMAGCCRGLEWPGAVAFLTLNTNPPAGFGVGEQAGSPRVPYQRTCRWPEVKRYLVNTAGAPDGADWVTLVVEFTKFLQEQDMAPDVFTLEDLSVTERWFSSHRRINWTFKEIRDTLQSKWPKSTRFLKDSQVLHSEGDALVWNWFFLKPPYAPSIEARWFIAWGIRFGAISSRWRNAYPPLPDTTHAFVCLGAEGRPKIPSDACSLVAPASG